MTGVAFFDIDSFQLEEGVVATEYERPAPTPDYPIEVKSLNDFDVVSSVGKENLLKNSGDFINTNHWVPYTSISSYEIVEKRMIIKTGDSGAPRLINGTLIPLNSESQEFTVSVEYIGDVDVTVVGKTSNSATDRNESGAQNVGSLNLLREIDLGSGRKRVIYKWDTLVETETIKASWLMLSIPVSSTVELINMKVKRGNTQTPWAPELETVAENFNHPSIDKINILLDEPLRSVGDVKDRLFRDSDGLWKVERNVEEMIFDGSQGFSINLMTPNNRLVLNLFTETNPKKVYTYKTNMFPYVPNGESNPFSTDYLVNQGSDAYNRFWVYTNKFSTNSEVAQFFKNNPLSILYDVHEPEIEILPMSTQDKLNNLSSFSNSNYVYTVDNNNLKPNLNVVFKSKGWKHKQTTDNLETDVSNKADKSDVESGFSDVNESIDEFRNNYESYQDSVAKSMEDASTELQKALERTSIIEANLGEGAADWIFTHTQIRMSDEGVMIGQKEAGSYLQISDNQISFFNGSEDPVAFINGGMLHINHAIFVESIQISGFMISSEIKDHITFRYVGN